MSHLAVNPDKRATFIWSCDGSNAREFLFVMPQDLSFMPLLECEYWYSGRKVHFKATIDDN